VAWFHTAIQCYVQGCSDQTIFLGQKALLEEHVREHHPPRGTLTTIPDQTEATFTCPEDGCDETFNHLASNCFNTLRFQKHLLKVHKIQDKAARTALVPKFPRNPCFFPGCNTTSRFKANKKGSEKEYHEHLAVAHGLKEYHDCVEYIWARIRGLILPARQQNQLSAEVVNSGDEDEDEDEGPVNRRARRR
jgi:hypothetical protein